MKILQINNYDVKNNKNKSISFKAYDIKVLEAGIKKGEVTAVSVIKEVHADAIKLSQSSNFDDKMKSGVLSTLVTGLLAVSKYKLWAEKAELEMQISCQRAKLLIAKSGEESEISKRILGYKDSIKKINGKLAELDKAETSINLERGSFLK
ncbi:hypothetical protein J6S88_01950 [bacterium]|nr:hypothetical protein [bacterium]